MARISFQVQPIPGEKKFKDFQENFETIMETLLYLQKRFSEDYRRSGRSRRSLRRGRDNRI